MALSNPPVNSNVNENWLFEFTADNKNCLDFDGSDDNINFGNILSTPFVNFTVEFWCKADAIGGGVVIQLSAGSGEDADENVSFNVNLQSGGEFQLFYEYGSGSNESNTTSSFDLSADTWTHVAVVRDDSSGEAYFYKNGTLVETETASNDPTGGTSADADLTIGNNFANNNGYNGELAHVRVWDTARTADEISHYYNRLVDSTHAGLVSYWKLDEGTGASVADSSSNSNSGTITGASWSIDGFDNFIHAFGISFKDTTVSSEFYHGSVLNKNITIRDSIDLVESTSNTGNISVTSANFDIHGTDFYKLLFNGTNNYHNKEIRVYAQFEGEDTLSSCQQIFSGRIVDMKLNQDQNITIQINSHRPWDKIEFPQDKSSKYNVYIPTVYGDFTPNTSTAGSPTFVGTALYPIPVVNTSQNDVTTLMPKSYADGSNCHVNLWLGDANFLPLSTFTSSHPIKDETELQEDINVLISPLNKRFNGIVRCKFSDVSTSIITFTDTYKAFDGDSTTVATAATTGTGTTTGSLVLGFAGPPRKFFATLIRKVYIYFKASQTGNVTVNVAFQSASVVFGSTVSAGTINVTDTNATNIATIDVAAADDYPTDLNSAVVFIYGASGKTISVSDIQMEAEVGIFRGTNADEDEQDSSELSNLKYLYSGGDGLTASWDSGAIAHGHDAHRDLLQRFAGISSTDPDNWSSLNTDRAIDNWKVRYWQLEPTNLKQALDKIAYEFGFVAKFTPTGTLKYIHVKKSSELSATLNLTSQDIDKVNISTTGINSIVTKMNISNDLSPAEQKYFANKSISNNANRAKYNLGDKEGIKQVNLDMNVGTIPTSANADCNADFYSYYNNIIGDMKILVSCDVVNPMKGCQLETGDIITFTDMPVEMFGTRFSASKYYMVIETKRSLGKVSITAREVG